MLNQQDITDGVSYEEIKRMKRVKVQLDNYLNPNTQCVPQRGGKGERKFIEPSETNLTDGAGS